MESEDPWLSGARNTCWRPDEESGKSGKSPWRIQIVDLNWRWETDSASKSEAIEFITGEAGRRNENQTLISLQTRDQEEAYKPGCLYYEWEKWQRSN